MDVTTLREDRPVNDREAEVIEWLLQYGSDQPLVHLREGVRRLRVVGRCGCGCASVDFKERGQSGRCHPIAQGYGQDPDGLKFGVILWGQDDAITGLEIYEGDPGSAITLPPASALRREP